MYSGHRLPSASRLGHRRAVRPRHRRARHRELVTTGAAVRLGRAVLLRLLRRRACWAIRAIVADRAVDHVRRFRGRLDDPRRHADRRDAGGGDGRVLARASLFHRLHARGPAPAALLLLSVALHLRDADAGDGEQFPADVLRLGRRGPRVLSADRLLVQEAGGQRRRDQGLHRQPRRRFRLRARHLRHLLSSSARSISTRCSPPRRRWSARRSSSPAITSTS